MQYKMIPWAPVYSHVAQMSLIQNVASNHLNKFPAGYFKNRWLNDKRSIQNLYKDKKFLNDLKLPAVAVSYEVDDDPKNTLEQGDYPYLYASHYMAGDLGTYYWKLFHNPKTKAEVYMAPVRMKITLTFKYLFPDINTRDDMYRFMLMTFRYAGPPDTYGLYNTVYAAVPQVMLNYIGNAEGYDLTKEDDLKQFNFELMAYSHRRFALKKTDLNRGDKMIFTKYEMPHMQLIQTQKPEKDDGEVKGQTKTNYGITETLEFEPYVPQMFITKLPEVINGRRIPDTYRPISASNQGIDDRLLATRNYHSDPVSKCLHGVKDLTPIADIEFTIDHDGEEEIDIDGELYGKMHLKIIKSLMRQKIDPNQFYRILLFVYDTQLHQDTDYSVDWETGKIKLFNSVPNGTYRLVSTAERRALEPYIRNALIHIPEEYDKVFPRKKTRPTVAKPRIPGSAGISMTNNNSEGDNYVK